MEPTSQTTCQPARQEFIMLALGCISLSIAAVGIFMTGLGTMVLSPFIGLGLIMGVRRLVHCASHRRYEHQRQQETRAYRTASTANDAGKSSLPEQMERAGVRDRVR
jgi:hypothetical protein